jgi:phage shock protein PspC (stress-responsive transcriptional regulator)
MHDGGMMSDTNTPTDAMTNSTTNQTRLQRSREQRIVAGVAGGLGQRFGVSPWWFRAGFIVLSAFGGLGLALYAIGWLLIPQNGQLDSIAAQWIGGADGSDASTWIGAGLLALAGLIVLGWIGVFDSAVFWAALLFLIGVMLYRGDLKIGSGNRQVPTDPDPPTPGSDPDSPEAGPDQTIEPDAIEGGGDEPPPSARQDPVPDPASPPSPKKPRSIVGRLTFGAVLLVLGAMALSDALGWIDPSFADYVAATIGVIGVGLLAGVVWGRSIALIVVGLLLLPLLFFSRFVPLNLNGEVGEVRYAPTTISQVQPEYRLAAGELRLDLSEVDLVGGTLNVLVEVGAGEVIIDLPPNAGFDIDASVGIGELRLLARHDTGIGIVSRVTEAGDGKLILEINLGAGSVGVRRQGSSQREELSSEQVDEILYEIGDAIGEEIGDAIGGVTP